MTVRLLDDGKVNLLRLGEWLRAFCEIGGQDGPLSRGQACIHQVHPEVAHSLTVPNGQFRLPCAGILDVARRWMFYSQTAVGTRQPR